MKLNRCNLPCCIISWVFLAVGCIFIYIIIIICLAEEIQSQNVTQENQDEVSADLFYGYFSNDVVVFQAHHKPRE